MTAIREPQFVVDAQGKPIAAVVDIKQYEALTELGETLHNVQQTIFSALDSDPEEQGGHNSVPSHVLPTEYLLTVFDEVLRGVDNEAPKHAIRALRDAMSSLFTEEALAVTRAAMDAIQHISSMDLLIQHHRGQLSAFDLKEGFGDNLPDHHDDDASFWMSASEGSLDTIWGNDEDDVYAQLLQE